MVADEDLNDCFSILELFHLITVAFCSVNPWDVVVDLLDVLQFVELFNLRFLRHGGDFDEFLILGDGDGLFGVVLDDGVDFSLVCS